MVPSFLTKRLFLYLECYSPHSAPPQPTPNLALWWHQILFHIFAIITNVREPGRRDMEMGWLVEAPGGRRRLFWVRLFCTPGPTCDWIWVPLPAWYCSPGTEGRIKTFGERCSKMQTPWSLAFPASCSVHQIFRVAQALESKRGPGAQGSLCFWDNGLASALFCLAGFHSMCFAAQCRRLGHQNGVDTLVCVCVCL